MAKRAVFAGSPLFSLNRTETRSRSGHPVLNSADCSLTRGAEHERDAMAADAIFFVLVGPSGAGKNTLMRRVMAQVPGLNQVATMTTREIRENEQEGVHHRFVSRERFQQAIDQNELIEYQVVHQKDLYGTPRDVVEGAIASGTDLIADIEFLGADRLNEEYPLHTVLIFVTPSNLRILADRIMQRGDIEPQELEGRLNRARFEMTYAPECHYLIMNDDLEHAERALRQIVLTERNRRRGEPLDPRDRVPAHQIDAYVTAIIQRNSEVLLKQGALPHFMLDADAPRLDLAARDHLQRELNILLQVVGPVDRRFDYPAPSHITVGGTPPHFALEYFYRFACSDAHASMPQGWQWVPRAHVALPDMLSEMVAP